MGGGMFMKVGILNGKKVITSDGKKLGEVEDTDINVENWTVTHLHVSLVKDISQALHFDTPVLGSVSVCLPVNTVKVAGEVILLNKSIEELKTMEEFKPQK
jgi:sporulation protein YlmC with PRC-barrel domain